MSTASERPEYPQPLTAVAPPMAVPAFHFEPSRNRAPLSQFTHRRRVLVFIATFTFFVGVASAVGNVAGNKVASLLTGDEGDFASYTWPTAIVALIVFMGGVWPWIDASMLRAHKPTAMRILVVVIAWTSALGFGGAFTVLLLLLTLLLGNPDALSLMAGFFVTLFVISCGAIPAAVAGELLSGSRPSPARSTPPLS